MKPVDFALFDGDSSPNTPVRKIAAAMKKPLRIIAAVPVATQFAGDDRRRVFNCSG